jgi:hypothetical protein
LQQYFEPDSRSRQVYATSFTLLKIGRSIAG